MAKIGTKRSVLITDNDGVAMKGLCYRPKFLGLRSVIVDHLKVDGVERITHDLMDVDSDGKIRWTSRQESDLNRYKEWITERVPDPRKETDRGDDSQ